MPQASEEDRKQWGGEAGVGEDKALDFLLDRGWTEVKGKTGFMMPPNENGEITWEEFDAMMFLIFEWDFCPAIAIWVVGHKPDVGVIDGKTGPEMENDY